ncbi:hypothetical protein D3C85_1029930 [compost metagenome]
MIEGEGAEGGRESRVPLDDHHLVIPKHLGQQGAQHGIGMGGELGELDHGSVAGGDGADEGPQAQHHREVPGHHDADDAQRLIVHLDPGGGQQQAGVAPRWPHPALEPFQAVVDLHDAGQYVGDQAVVVAALAIVQGQGVAQGLLVGEQGPLECAQPVAALLQARHGMGLTGLLEAVHLLGQGELVWGLCSYGFHGMLRTKTDRLISRSKPTGLLPACKHGRTRARADEWVLRWNCARPHSLGVSRLVNYPIRGSFQSSTQMESST